MTEKRIVITQGGQAVSADPGTVISTVLGSCVSVCLWDPLAEVGGMNHMLLTSTAANSIDCNLAGLNAMELLINAMLKKGVRRSRLVAKVFGGAQMVDGLPSIGANNVGFTMDFLRRERILVAGKSLGGTRARQLLFWPATGVVKQKVAQSIPDVGSVGAPRQGTPGNGLELL